MAKDPAMLWYWNDWHSGTVLMSRFLKGCYIDLLHAQFNNGPLSLDEVKAVLGGDFGQSWPTLQRKFSVNPEGLFFNERLELEKTKRKDFTESRRKNRLKKTYDTSYDKDMIQHMTNHMENENRNINSISNAVDYSKQAEVKFSVEQCLEISLKDERWVNENKTNRQELLAFNSEMIGTGQTERNPADYKRHFYHWKKNGKLGNLNPVKKMVI